MLYLTIILFGLFIFAFRKAPDQTELYSFNLHETMPLRAILAISVMLCHLCPHLDEESPLLAEFCLWGPPSVGTFFLLTGYGLSYSYQNKGEDYLNGFFKKRIMRLLWPLLIMTIIYQCYRAYNGVFDVMLMLKEPSPMSWFIYAVMIWYVIFYVSFKFRWFRKNSSIISIWLLTVVYMTITVYFKFSYYWISILPLPIAISYVPYETWIKHYIQKNKYHVLGSVFCFVMVVMIYAVIGSMTHGIPLWGPPVYTVVPCTLLLLTYFIGGWKCRFLVFLGKISYEFYIVHGFVVILLSDVHWFGLNGYVNAFMTIAIVLTIATACACVMNRICGKLNDSLLKFSRQGLK